MKLALGALLLVVLTPGCQRDHTPSAPSPGHERGDCRADKTCEPGLLCLSSLCVRPPPGDCQAVAEQLASIDLGNYAEPETRAPVVARYTAACEAALVSRDEARCVDQARDKVEADHCVPRMFSPHEVGTR